MKNLWHRVLGFEDSGRGVVIESVEFDPDVEEIVATVHRRRNARRRCGVCSRRSPGYDRGRTTVRCRTHGVVASEVCRGPVTGRGSPGVLRTRSVGSLQQHRNCGDRVDADRLADGWWDYRTDPGRDRRAG